MGGFIESCWGGGAVRVGYLVDAEGKLTLPVLQVLFSRDYFVHGAVVGDLTRLSRNEFLEYHVFSLLITRILLR